MYQTETIGQIRPLPSITALALQRFVDLQYLKPRPQRHLFKGKNELASVEWTKAIPMNRRFLEQFIAEYAIKTEAEDWKKWLKNRGFTYDPLYRTAP